jgi:hypothetical protein
MIEIPHPIHTPIRSSSYLYKVFLILLLWLVVIWMQPQHDIALSPSLRGIRWLSWTITCSMCKVMIGAPHPPHTHRTSLSCINKVIQQVLLRLAIIWMQPQPDMLGLTVTVVVVGDSLGFSLVSCCVRLWLVHPNHLTHFKLIADRLQAYMLCFSTFYCGWQSYGCNPTPHTIQLSESGVVSSNLDSHTYTKIQIELSTFMMGFRLHYGNCNL